MAKRTPAYCLHKATGQAVVRIDGKDFYLGKHGTEASKAEYDRLIAEWYANHQCLPRTDRQTGLTVNQLLVAYWKHAEQHYRRPDGTPTDELHCLKAAFRPLRQLYGDTPAAEFGPLALKAVRQKMIESVDERTGRPWCRRSINLHTYRVRSVFRWAVENELVPSSVLHGLQAVRGLQLGRSPARETGSVKPVPEAYVEATLPHVNRVVRAMIEVQRLTGARPGEVIIMRGIDLDMSGSVWLYRPGSDRELGQHKTAHHGHQRVIAIGPRAQEVIKPFLTLSTGAYLFRPAEANDDPKWATRRKPGPCYTVDSYRQAVERGCDRAFPPPAPLGRAEDETFRKWRKRLTVQQKTELRAWQKAHRWHPHQLRHTKATQIRREFGLDEARAVLGHRSATITEVYAEIDANTAAEVMKRLG